jgi:hypothetical protein
MNETHQNIIRLVDGEMTPAERQAFLQNLDQNSPESWRDLALGFVENQMITEALRAHEEVPIAEPISIKRSPVWSPSWLGATAAALLLGLIVGAISMGPENSNSSDPITRTEDPPTTTADPSPVDRRQTYLTGGIQPLEDLNSSLRDQGYQPRMTRGYLEAQLKDGRSVIVPISQMAFDDKN